MTPKKLGLVGGLVFASLAAALLSQHLALEKIRSQNAELELKISQLSNLQKENERLSNILSQVSGNAKLTHDQMDELLRLRREVARRHDLDTPPPPPREYRRPAPSAPSLTATLISTNASTTRTTSIPKSEWTYAGYDTPEAALQTVVWAMSMGDIQTFQSSLSQNALRSMTSAYEGRTEAEIAAALVQRVSNMTELSFDKKTIASDGRTSFVLSTGDSRNDAVLTFQYINGQWRISE